MASAVLPSAGQSARFASSAATATAPAAAGQRRRRGGPELGTDRPPLTEEQVLGLSARLREPPGLGALRLAGLHAYQAQELPSRSDHRWRYSDPLDLLPTAPLIAPRSSRPRISPPLRDAGAVAVLDPGAEPSIVLSEAANRAGVQILPLHELQAQPDGLGTAAAPTLGLFEALNTAAWTDGVLVRIPRGCTVASPIRLVLPAVAGVHLPRVLVVLEPDAEATVIEEHVGGASGAHVVAVSELFAGAGARLRYGVVETWTPGVVGHLTERIVASRDARVLTVLHSFGGSRLKLDLGVDLAGIGAHSEIVGFALADGQQQLDHRIEHRHRAARTGSNIDMKLAVGGRARTAATGRIRIDESAQGSEAYQELRNLLLSHQCRADAIPELEILTNEVQCTHGATSAPIDGEQLFYLASRAIPPAEATRMIVRGFFEGALRRLPLTVRRPVEGLVEARLAELATPQEDAP